MKRKVYVPAVVCFLMLFALADSTPAEEGTGFRIVKGQGTVCAAGHGAIQFHGSGDLIARAQGGQVIINDDSAVVSVKGAGIRHQFANGWVLYQGFHGEIRLSGDNLFGQVLGTGIRMGARGEGIMLLAGRGVYKVPCGDPDAPLNFPGVEGVGIELGSFVVDSESVGE